MEILLFKIIVIGIFIAIFFFCKSLLKVCEEKYNKIPEEERKEAFTVINTQITEYWWKKLFVIMVVAIVMTIIIDRSIPPINIEEYMKIRYFEVLYRIVIKLFQILNFILTLSEVTLVFLAISLMKIKNLPKKISAEAKIYYAKPFIIFYFCFLMLKPILAVLILV
ncbi:hypothetical protein [Fusobacterium varium]|uniref:hypothetical protein n=1 Tax=Fusobacterium varium TaxID=856 RepID=UPI001F38000D|nr:hypothetical protein [Fusobacterium varium]MCF2673631.1 hypothetical protein [Fusobacterium varium]